MRLENYLKEHFEKKQPLFENARVGLLIFSFYPMIGFVWCMANIFLPLSEGAKNDNQVAINIINITLLILVLFFSGLIFWKTRYHYGDVAKRLCRGYLRRHKEESFEDLEKDFAHAKKFGEKEEVCFVGKKHIFHAGNWSLKIWNAEEITWVYLKGEHLEKQVHLCDVKQDNEIIATVSIKEYDILKHIRKNMPHVITEPETEVLLDKNCRRYQKKEAFWCWSWILFFGTFFACFFYGIFGTDKGVHLLSGNLAKLLWGVMIAAYAVWECVVAVRHLFLGKKAVKKVLSWGNVLENIFECMKIVSFIIILLLILQIGNTRLWVCLLFGMGALVYLAGFLGNKKVTVSKEEHLKEELNLEDLFNNGEKLLIITGASLGLFYDGSYDWKAYLILLIPVVLLSVIVKAIHKRKEKGAKWECILWFFAVYIFCMGGIKFLNQMHVNRILEEEKVVKNFDVDDVKGGVVFDVEFTDGSERENIGQDWYVRLNKGDCIKIVTYEGFLKLRWTEMEKN